jgi:hypothetical protein
MISGAAVKKARKSCWVLNLQRQTRTVYETVDLARAFVVALTASSAAVMAVLSKVFVAMVSEFHVRAHVAVVRAVL